LTYVWRTREGVVLESLVANDHSAVSYRVWVSPCAEKRWAAVECDCGSWSYLEWVPNMNTYRDLVTAAWQLGCGITQVLDEAFRQ